MLSYKDYVIFILLFISLHCSGFDESPLESQLFIMACEQGDQETIQKMVKMNANLLLYDYSCFTHLFKIEITSNTRYGIDIAFVNHQ
ncbi:MAG: hypothetical protein HAW62_04540 [Endozoicomonadaceae bacterium]|nr:hypothetical protein [Endozoicomonadaceae bacterium]